MDEIPLNRDGRSGLYVQVYTYEQYTHVNPEWLHRIIAISPSQNNFFAAQVA